jgi:hypothetical protein
LKIKIALFIGSLFVLGGILLWRQQIDPLHLGAYFNRSSPDPVPETTPAQPPEAPKPVRVRARKPAVVETAPRPVIAEVAPKPVVTAKPAAPPVNPPPFPQVDQIANGASAAAVIDKYGTPAISALTSDRGHVMGTYVYAKDKGRSETVIQLEDGKVASAFSKSMPPPPVGILVPRLGNTE